METSWNNNVVDNISEEHIMATQVNILTWSICSKVKDIQKENPYLLLSPNKLTDAEIDLIRLYYNWLLSFNIYEILIDYIKKIK